MLSLEEDICSLRASPLLIDTSINNSCSPHKELMLLNADARPLVGGLSGVPMGESIKTLQKTSRGYFKQQSYGKFHQEDQDLHDEDGLPIISRMPVAFSLSRSTLTQGNSPVSTHSSIAPSSSSEPTPKLNAKRLGSDLRNLKIDTNCLHLDLSSKSTPVAGAPRRRLSPSSASSFNSPLLQPPPPSSNPLLTTDLSAISFASNSNSTLAYSASSSVYEMLHSPNLANAKSADPAAAAITALFSGTSEMEMLRNESKNNRGRRPSVANRQSSVPNHEMNVESTTFSSSSQTLHDYGLCSASNSASWLNGMNPYLYSSFTPNSLVTSRNSYSPPSSWSTVTKSLNIQSSADGMNYSEIQQKQRKRILSKKLTQSIV